MSATLEQDRATRAYRHVAGLASNREDYGTLALKLPALLRTSGLCQTLHFLAARTRQREAAQELLRHLAEQLTWLDAEIRNEPGRLCERAREAPLPLYVGLAREAVAVASWYSRLARSELGADLTTESGHE